MGMISVMVFTPVCSNNSPLTALIALHAGSCTAESDEIVVHVVGAENEHNMMTGIAVGAGGIKPSWKPGQPVLISDHINLTGASPLEGATFIDLTDLYSVRLRDVARMVDPTLDEGVYCQFRGPQYETPAEVRMAKTIGGHIVGMSTALEAIAARQAGMEILGFSLITNMAAGIQTTPLSHQEVIEAGKAAEPVISALLARTPSAVLGPLRL